VSLAEYPLAEMLTPEGGRTAEWEAVGNGPPLICGPAWNRPIAAAIPLRVMSRSLIPGHIPSTSSPAQSEPRCSTGWPRAIGQRRRRLRHQHLTAVRDSRDPRRPVHIQPHQPRRRRLRLARVHAHPYPDLLPARPRMRPQRQLHFQRRRHARPRRGEHREEPVPGGIHLLALVLGQSRPDQPMMVSQNPRIHAPAYPLQQSRGPLNIGEQEREHPHRDSVKPTAASNSRQRGTTPATTKAHHATGKETRQTPPPGSLAQAPRASRRQIGHGPAIARPRACCKIPLHRSPRSGANTTASSAVQ
jgi:hypothetical protein